jgi:hypothetical protein
MIEMFDRKTGRAFARFNSNWQAPQPICCAWPKVRTLPKRQVREELTEDQRARSGEVGR